MDDHSTHEMDEMMEAPEDPEEWEDEEDWDDDDDDLDDLIEEEDLTIPEARDHKVSIFPVTPDGDRLRVGDEVRIVGDIAESDKEVYIGEQMHRMINDGKTYIVREINKMDSYIVMCGGWNWSIRNIKKLIPDKKVKKESIFHYDPQHIDLS